MSSCSHFRLLQKHLYETFLVSLDSLADSAIAHLSVDRLIDVAIA
jgi:hypothetical protein